MKKLLLIVSVLSLVSCVTPTEEGIEKRVKEIRERSLANRVYKVDYEGHTYLLLDANSMCHDENCKCKLKE